MSLFQQRPLDHGCFGLENMRRSSTRQCRISFDFRAIRRRQTHEEAWIFSHAIISFDWIEIADEERCTRWRSRHNNRRLQQFLRG